MSKSEGMDASPRGGEADMESAWPGSGGPLCDSGDIAMSSLLLSDSSSSTVAGCYGTDLADASSVRLSPDRSAPGSSGESAPGGGPSAASSPILAGPSMVLGPDFSPRRLSIGDSRQEGSPPTGGGHYCPPSPGAVEAVEAVGVASEGAQLIASGLSTEVVETILQSRAPSTRKLYALKWNLFKPIWDIYIYIYIYICVCVCMCVCMYILPWKNEMGKSVLQTNPSNQWA